MSISNPDQLAADIQELVPELVALRRDFHEHPELAFEEVRTANIVAQRLRHLGLEVQTGVAKTGVIGLLRGEAGGEGQSTRTLAIRADMDALPIHELNKVEYRSQVDGKMHACGHDGHTAIALEVAEVLSRRKAELRGNIKFIFQPAEEGAGGAHAMMKEHVMDGVDAVIGLHLASSIPSGRVAVTRGASQSAANMFTLTVKGKGGHAAAPEETVDTIMISVHIIEALYSLMSRATSPNDPIIISIGSINAGSASNIIPEIATIKGTLRTYSVEKQQEMLQRIRELASGIASAMQGSCELRSDDSCPPCINDVAMAELVERAATASVGAERVDSYTDRRMGPSDDMGFMLLTAPGCYFNLGTGNEAKETNYAHHHPRFDVDEEALPVGVEVMARAALEYLR
ncbi:MAG: M20 family metallopeptidase [Ktedonobacteraceae bacterium]